MLYQSELMALPRIHAVYTVTRKTVWQIADPYHILIAVKEGACTVETGGEVFDLSAGDLFFIPAMQNYTRRPKDDLFCTMTYIHFSFDGEVVPVSDAEAAEAVRAGREEIDRALLSEAPAAPKNPLYLSSVTHGENLVETVSQIEEKYLRTRVETNLWVCSSLSHLLALMTESALAALPKAQSGQKTAKTSKKLRRAILYIRQNFRHAISLDDLAAYSGVSKQQLIRTFRSELGTTPAAYITEMRIDRAKEIFLTQPHLSVKEVSAELGFLDQHYFSRVFVKQTGETPTAYQYRVTHYEE